MKRTKEEKEEKLAILTEDVPCVLSMIESKEAFARLCEKAQEDIILKLQCIKRVAKIPRGIKKTPLIRDLCAAREISVSTFYNERAA